MTVCLRWSEECKPCYPCRYGTQECEDVVYHRRPPCGQPRITPKQRYVRNPPAPCSRVPCDPPCCYDLPCKAHCFNHGHTTRPSGRYARTVWFPGEWPPKVSPCAAFTCPNPPYHHTCLYTCNKPTP